jgi:monofunctional biosynthetic peptidoglycan transglycosylase
VGPEGQFGIEAAARFAFRKSARELTPAEAAEFAAVLPNPVRRSARAPSTLVHRLAALYQRRAASYPGHASCLRNPVH